MRSNIPSYFTEKKNVIWTVCGTALFAELFILIYKPFGSSTWTDKPFVYIGVATVVVLVAMGVIAVSRTIMYQYAKKHDIAVWEFSIWLVAELLAMSVIYSLAASVVTHDYDLYFEYFNEAIRDTFFTLFIPYTAFYMSFALIDKDKEIKRLNEELSKKAETAEGEHVAENKSGPETYNFRDERGELKLSVKSDAIYYIESADNYVVIYYKNGNKVPRYILRSTMKRLEEEFMNTALVRCSRSYMVNFNAIKVITNTDDGLFIDFGVETLPKIPVSKTYSARFMEKFK